MAKLTSLAEKLKTEFNDSLTAFHFEYNEITLECSVEALKHFSGNYEIIKPSLLKS